MDNCIKIEQDYVKSLLPQRALTAHKGNFGKVLLLCGSVGFTGAAEMAAKAAARCGSGLVFVGVPQEVYAIVAGKLTEPMVFPLPSADGKLSAAAVREVLHRLQGMDAVLVGPGLGQCEGVRAVVEAILSHAHIPVVLDADGINVLARNIDVIRESTCPILVTPHAGEFARMGGNLINQSREAAAKELAQRLGCICVLKGHETVVTDGETVLVNTTGNPGMATGGSGDVLGGMLVSLLGQHLRPLDAAAAAVWLHGRAGDICAEELGQYGMLPSDMIAVLPRILP